MDEWLGYGKACGAGWMGLDNGSAHYAYGLSDGFGSDDGSVCYGYGSSTGWGSDDATSGLCDIIGSPEFGDGSADGAGDGFGNGNGNMN